MGPSGCSSDGLWPECALLCKTPIPLFVWCCLRSLKQLVILVEMALKPSEILRCIHGSITAPYLLLISPRARKGLCFGWQRCRGHWSGGARGGGGRAEPPKEKKKTDFSNGIHAYGTGYRRGGHLLSQLPHGARGPPVEISATKNAAASNDPGCASQYRAVLCGKKEADGLKGKKKPGPGAVLCIPNSTFVVARAASLVLGRFGPPFPPILNEREIRRMISPGRICLLCSVAFRRFFLFHHRQRFLTLARLHLSSSFCLGFHSTSFPTHRHHHQRRPLVQRLSSLSLPQQATLLYVATCLRFFLCPFAWISL